MPVAPDVIAPDDSLDDEYGDIDHGTVAPLLETDIPVIQTVGVVDDVVGPQPSAGKEEGEKQIDVGIHEEGIDGVPP